MSLSSRYLAPCIPPPEGAQGLGALGRSRRVSHTREWVQGDALGTIVLSDGAWRSKQDLETQGEAGRAPRPLHPMPQECDSTPGGARIRPAPLDSRGAARPHGRSAGYQPLAGCHGTLGTGTRGRGEGCPGGRCPRRSAPGPSVPRAQPAAAAGPAELRLLRLLRLPRPTAPPCAPAWTPSAPLRLGSPQFSPRCSSSHGLLTQIWCPGWSLGSAGWRSSAQG